MPDAFTARAMTIGKAPARIDLLGDKTKRPEPAQHIITFPGGAIELSRTSDGHYWAHILVNRGWAIDDTPGFHQCIGEVVGSRLDTGTGAIDGLPREAEIRQIAVLVKPLQGSPTEKAHAQD